MGNKANTSSDVISIDVRPLLTPIAIIIGAIMISASVLIGFTILKSAYSNSNNTASNGANTLGVTSQPTSQPKIEFESAKTIIGDAPYLGNNKAKVAVVEYTDFECPYCKRHHDHTYPSIIKDYVDSGKIVYIIKSFPLSFHDPVATNAAVAALCARELGGNEKYFAYVDKYFAKTATNGAGVGEGGNEKIAAELGLNADSFVSCLNNTSIKDKVKSQIKDGQDAGISGTPGFVIGTIKDDGTVEGKRIDGAYSYDTFKQIIEEYL